VGDGGWNFRQDYHQLASVKGGSELKRTFYLFSKVILAVSKVRHLTHLPPLRYGHDNNVSNYS
jgi:hypothetical protein